MERKLAPFSEEDKEKFKDVVFVIEATDFERFALWQMNDTSTEKYRIKSWESISDGWLCTIGHVDEMPVTVSLTYAKLNGHKVAFYYAASMIVDYNMVREWIAHYTGHLQFEGRVCHTDANNFGHCYRRVGVFDNEVP